MSKVNVNIDRRDFIVAAGAAAAVAYLPPPGLAEELAASAAAAPELLTDWHIDDMWGVYPRPSEPIGFAPPLNVELVAAHHPADAAYLA
jgi:hypothetical protein